MPQTRSACRTLVPEHKHAHRLALVSPGSSVPCWIDADVSYVPKARYALRMLLVPLGLEPRWVDRREASGAVYYGRDPARASRARACLTYSSKAEAFFDSGRAFDLEAVTWRAVGDAEVPVCFTGDDGRPDFVASAFLWLSGWQERASNRRDEHGRVTFARSMNAGLGTARLPVVDAYREELAELLRGAGVQVRRRRWAGRSWAFCPTHDVDYVRKWRAGILYRELIQYLALNRRREPWARRMERAARVFRQLAEGDPYVRALHELPLDVAGRGGTATYFIKAGAGDPHDVPYRVGSSFLRRWLEQVSDGGFEVGLHPSYRTLDEPDRLRVEKERLERVAGRPVTSVRQHYLRYDPAATPAIHQEAGFAIDSTLGYAEHEGFRRGTCMPFQLYDLRSDRPMDVWELPLAVMESALFNRRGLDLDQAADATRVLSAACRRYGGVLVGLWHATLGDEIDCPGWREHFLRTLDEAHANDAFVVCLEGALREWR